MADSTSGNLTLPEFDNDKAYILNGKTLNGILDVIKENRIVLTGDLQYSETGPMGSQLPLSKLVLKACINGVSQNVTFIVVPSGGSTGA